MEETKKSRSFIVISAITVLMTLGLILFGAVVRVTDSGLGCGNEWPLCDGTIVPPLDNVTAWIEWLHRLFAFTIGLFGLVMLVLSIRHYRQHKRLVMYTTILAAILFAFQSALGALVVILDLPPTMVTMHLGTAMLLFAALIVAYIGASYTPKQYYPRDTVTLLAYLTAALALIIILTGALVRGSGATLACTDWPLCNGEVFPINQGQLQLIHVIHRYAVVGLGIAVILLGVYVFRSRQSTLIRTLTLTAVGFYFAQALVGAAFVLTAALPIWGVLHVGFAAMTWATLVGVCVVDTLNSHEVVSQTEESTWKLQSEHSLT